MKMFDLFELPWIVVLVLLFVIVFLCKHILGEKARRDHYETQNRYDIFEGMKQRTLSNIELSAKKHKQHKKLEEDMRILERKISQLTKEAEELNGTKIKHEATIEKMKRKLEDYQQRNFRLIEEQDKLKAELCQKGKGLEKTRCELEREHKNQQKLTERLQNLEKRLALEKENNRQLKERHSELSSALRSQISDLKDKVEQLTLENDAVRHFCKKLQKESLAKENELQNAMNILNKVIEQKSAELSANTSMNKSLKESLAKLKDKYERAKQNFEDKLKEMHEYLLAKMVLDEMQKEKQETVAKYKELNDRFQSTLVDLKEYCGEIEKIIDKKKEHDKNKQELLDLRKKLDNAKRFLSN